MNYRERQKYSRWDLEFPEDETDHEDPCLESSLEYLSYWRQHLVAPRIDSSHLWATLTLNGKSSGDEGVFCKKCFYARMQAVLAVEDAFLERHGNNHVATPVPIGESIAVLDRAPEFVTPPISRIRAKQRLNEDDVYSLTGLSRAQIERKDADLGGNVHESYLYRCLSLLQRWGRVFPRSIGTPGHGGSFDAFFVSNDGKQRFAVESLAFGPGTWISKRALAMRFSQLGIGSIVIFCPQAFRSRGPAATAKYDLWLPRTKTRPEGPCEVRRLIKPTQCLEEPGIPHVHFIAEPEECDAAGRLILERLVRTPEGRDIQG